MLSSIAPTWVAGRVESLDSFGNPVGQITIGGVLAEIDGF